MFELYLTAFKHVNNAATDSLFKYKGRASPSGNNEIMFEGENWVLIYTFFWTKVTGSFVNFERFTMVKVIAAAYVTDLADGPKFHQGFDFFIINLFDWIG